MKGVSTRFGVFFPGFPRLRLGEITIPQTCKLNRCSDSLLKPEIFISGLYLFFLGLNILQASEICIRRIPELRDLDRKSTRLNSSHVAISYAVFCLKKKI